MATTIKIRGTSDLDKPVVLLGRATRPLTRITSVIRARIIREIPLPIESVVEEPEVVFTAQMTAPGQLQQSQGTPLSVGLFSQSPPGGPLTIVEDYDSTHWDKAIVSGGASATLGGVNGDLLTATATLGTVVVEFTYNVADSPAFGTIASATVEVVATPTFEVVLTGLPASAVQDNVYTLGAQRRDPTTDEVLDDDPANFTFSITAGASFGSIINGNQLRVNASTAGNSITVRATHNTGGEFDDGTTNIVVQPTFADNEPSDMTQLVFENGSTKNFVSQGGAWVRNGDWNDDNRVSVVADGASKHGNAIEKRFFLGEAGGWHGVTSRSNFAPGGYWKELFFRIVFKLSSNWQWHGGGGKWFYYRAADGAHGNFILMWQPNGRLSWAAQSQGGRYVSEGIPVVSRDVYHTIECHHGASTAGANGFFRAWLNGVEVPSWSVLGTDKTGVHIDEGMEWEITKNMADKRIGGIETFMFWGGSGGQKNVDDLVRLSELFISGRQ